MPIDQKTLAEIDGDQIDELLKIIKRIFDEAPFNAFVGMKMEHADEEHVTARFEMKPELVGNPVQKILHGGVISAVLDSVGGASAILSAFINMDDLPSEARYHRLARLGTVDIRIDYLRPGRGEWFKGCGKTVRVGNKIVHTTMELHNDQDELIAVGSATYLY